MLTWHLNPVQVKHKHLNYLKRIDDAIWEVNDELMEELNDTVDFVNLFLSFHRITLLVERKEVRMPVIFLCCLRDLENSGTSSYEIVNRVQAESRRNA